MEGRGYRDDGLRGKTGVDKNEGKWCNGKREGRLGKRRKREREEIKEEE